MSVHRLRSSVSRLTLASRSQSRSCALMTFAKGTTIHPRSFSEGFTRRAAADAMVALRHGGGVPSGHCALAEKGMTPQDSIA